LSTYVVALLQILQIGCLLAFIGSPHGREILRSSCQDRYDTFPPLFALSPEA
jgi:hypothetical protein